MKAPQAESVQIGLPLQLRYNIELHLPATKGIEVYDAVLKSLKENLGE